MSNKSKKTKWIVIIGCLLIITAIGYYKFNWLKAYYYNAKYNNFKTGDKLYPPHFFYNEKESLSIALYRLIRPITSEDVDKMDIEEWKKALVKQNLKSSSDLRIIESNKTIELDSLKKHNTFCIGTYVDNILVPTVLSGKTYIIDYYSINPNWYGVRMDDYTDPKMPGGYTYADDKFYVLSFEAVTKQKFTTGKQ